jgi:hypothetical protein
MSKTTQGMNLIYNGGVQSGDGLMDWIKKAKSAHDFVKKNKLISKAVAIGDSLGATGYLDKRTGGKYSKGASFAKKKGYGKKKKAVARTRKR